LKAAKEIGFPVALKTAMPNIHHKSECGGVMLDIQCEEELITSYNKMNDHLGKNVIVTKMQLQGQEMILGVKNDPQFGPIIILGLGGFFTELMKDIVFAVPPFNEEFALELLGKLKFHEALMGYRESKLLNITSFCKYASRFSFMVHELREVISEIDINPLIINQDDCVAVDALIVGKRNISP
jgi:hypothetical protein